MSEPPPCPLCSRPTYRLMKHHMVPKSKGGKETIPSCRDCHKAIHVSFTNNELRDYYHTIPRLLESEKFRKMIAYIKKQDPRKKVSFRMPSDRCRK